VARLLAEGADMITFTSSSTVENFCNLVDLHALLAKFPQLELASIGPITTETIRKHGFEVGVEAARHDISGLTEAVKTLLMARRA
jgi:uroporphyrinogen III methyltransferase/synthase